MNNARGDVVMTTDGRFAFLEKLNLSSISSTRQMEFYVTLRCSIMLIRMNSSNSAVNLTKIGYQQLRMQ